MRILRRVAPLSAAGAAVAVGNFDGMHLGHQALLQRLRRDASSQGLLSAVMLFEPQPREWFDPAGAPPRLMRLRDKLEYLRAAPVDCAICLRFDARLAGVSAERFVTEFLVAGLGARRLVFGADFRFGSGRRGDRALLESLQRQCGYRAAPVEHLELDGERVSSSRIRAALRRGDLAGVRRLLGREFGVRGRVSPGAGRGRRLGVPTANIVLRRQPPLPAGVFVSRLRLATGPQEDRGAWRDSVSYVGTRPSFGGGPAFLETHVLDFDGDLYRRRVEVLLLARLRGDRPFASTGTLVRRMRDDIRRARECHHERRRRARQDIRPDRASLP